MESLRGRDRGGTCGAGADDQPASAGAELGRAGEDEDLLFELGPVELELTVAVSKEAGPNAKVRFWVLELGADGKVASQATQRVKLTSILATEGSWAVQ